MKVWFYILLGVVVSLMVHLLHFEPVQEQPVELLCRGLLTRSVTLHALDRVGNVVILIGLVHHLN